MQTGSIINEIHIYTDFFLLLKKEVNWIGQDPKATEIRTYDITDLGRVSHLISRPPSTPWQGSIQEQTHCISSQIDWNAEDHMTEPEGPIAFQRGKHSYVIDSP